MHGIVGLSYNGTVISHIANATQLLVDTLYMQVLKIVWHIVNVFRNIN